MTSAALRSQHRLPVREPSGAPRLRLLPKRARLQATDASQPWPREAGVQAQPAGRHAVRRPGADPGSNALVLVAGTDAGTRAAVRAELGQLMPEGTRFTELGTFWELLAHAPSSRMVFLSGGLDELPAETLLRSLGHRHPDLPVVSLERQPSG